MITAAKIQKVLESYTHKKIFFIFETLSRNEYFRSKNQKHFDFCSLIRIFAIRLNNSSSL